MTFDDFLAAPGPILDVRSPGEYHQGHIPGAISFPIFTDSERAAVGTCYKQQGREAAVELGFDIAGPKFGQFIRQAQSLAPDKQVRLHCWRGGMRSGAIAWVLDLAGFQSATLSGGYKAFRQWVRCTVETPRPIVLLSGMTGTAKTDILHALADQGEQVLDLEGLASHRGSSFGGLGLPPQPTTEQFENLIALCWHGFDPQQRVWIEAESRGIGSCRIPPELFAQMEAAAALEITRPLEERLSLLVDLYGQADSTGLVEATERIRKRLGGQRTQDAIALIQAGDLRAAFAILLTYYDRTYRYGLELHARKAVADRPVTPEPKLVAVPEVAVTGLSPAQAAQRLRTFVEQGRLKECNASQPTVKVS